jgi:hypothetical protein
VCIGLTKGVQARAGRPSQRSRFPRRGLPFAGIEFAALEQRGTDFKNGRQILTRAFMRIILARPRGGSLRQANR